MTSATQAATDTIELPVEHRIPGLVIRRFAGPEDYAGLAELHQAASREDDVPWLPTADQLRVDMENRIGSDLRRDLLLAELDGRVVGTTSVARAVRDGEPVYEMHGAVAPDLRRRGLGTALHEWTIGRIEQRAPIEDPGVNVQVQGEAEDQEVGHRVLLAAQGFKPVRHFFLMRRPNLADVPDTELPEGIEIRPVTEEQLRTILEAEFEAFEDHWGHREPTEASYTMTLSRKELDTDLWVVAWDGDQVAGAVENWIWADENEQLGIKRGWLERISVRRPWRRRGLARALTARSLIRLREAGMGEGMLGVDSQNPNGALGLYEGLGFEVYSRAAAYRRPLFG